MAKVTAPALSFGAGGQIGKSMVYGKWRGVPYVRRHVVPANPRTTAQTLTRGTFALLREMWKRAPSEVYDAWNAFAQGRPFTGMNKFVGENLRVLRGEPDMANFIGSPGAKGGLPPDSAVASVAVADQIAVTVTPPAAPSGWSVVSAILIVFPNQDPSGIFGDAILQNVDVAEPYVPTVVGLTTGTEYVWSAWLKWEKPDGSFAYSVAMTGVETVT